MKAKSVILLFSVLILGLISFNSCKKKGCTDPSALNYKKKAINDNGKCKYDIEILTGYQNSDITLRKTSSLPNGTDYFIEGAWTIYAGVTIEPGVVIVMKENARIFVNDSGYINANGTADKKIILKGFKNEAGYWDGIRFISENEKNILNHVIIQDGGGNKFWEGAIHGDKKGSLKITNTEINNSKNYGLRIISKEFKLQEFSHVTIKNCQKGALIVNSRHMNKFDSTSHLINNGKNYFEVEEGSIFQTIKKTNHPYYINGNIHAGYVKLEPGVIFLMGENKNIYVHGYFNAIGTETDKIIITGMEKTKGYWGFIKYHNSGSILNNFQFTEISYGGVGTNSHGTIYLENVSNLRIGNSIISNSSKWGIHVSDTTLPYKCTLINDGNNTFFGNELGDIKY